MTFESSNGRLNDLPIPTSASSGASASSPAGLFLSDVPCKPLTWLWPGRIPLGHLTLLDAAPDCGLSLFALTLAACVSSGSPFPDGTPTQQGNVILFAPYDSASDTLKPRLEAAGGDPAHVLLFRPRLEDPSRTTTRTRSFALPHDLDHLAAAIRDLDTRLVILDPACAIAGLSRYLPALIELAHQTNCAILLTRRLSQPLADPLHSSGPTSLLLDAARSRLLLTSDPADERRHLLLTTRHPLCAQPAILAYEIHTSEGGIPTIHWLDERDRSHLARLSTGPLRSPHRQAILRFLQHSASPQSISEVLKATCYDRDAGHKMLIRMKMAGELVSTARGLYTTANHPCLEHLTDDTPPTPNVPNVPTVPDIPSSSVSNVPNVPIVPTPQSPSSGNSSQNAAPPIPAVPVTDYIASMIPSDQSVPNVPNAAHGTSELAQQQIAASPVPNVPNTV
ncbi:MAG: AAA family ATPase [Ktedonobacteraceae bacterium]